MKFLIITLMAMLFLTLTARADDAVTVYLYKANPSAPEAFSEAYHWRMDKSDDFRRFEYLSGSMKKGEKDKINPYTRKPAQMIVLGVKDENGITGKDYYLTPDGIMITSSAAHSKYFEDANNFYKFLKDETLRHSTFEKFPGEKISSDAPGLVVRYLINEALPNPAWLINQQQDVNLYDSFMRKLPEISGYQFQSDSSFDAKGNFVLTLNYPKAPGKFVTVNKTGLRLSNTYSKDDLLLDQKKYYEYFYKLTQENMNTAAKTKTNDRLKIGNGNF